MEAMKLAGLQPASVFGYFEKLCSMPHGSGNTRIISDYLVSFAKEQGIRYIQDELNNVIFFQEGTCGYEDHAPVVLQGHMDMVCEKDADCPIDMERKDWILHTTAGASTQRAQLWAVTTALRLPMPWLCWRTSSFPIHLWK